MSSNFLIKIKNLYFFNFIIKVLSVFVVSLKLKIACVRTLRCFITIVNFICTKLKIKGKIT